MFPLYVAGLIGPGDRKSIQPMAARLGLLSHDALHHFISASRWDAEPLGAELMERADRLVGGSDAVLSVDDIGLPKKGTASVDVAPQYASMPGKHANCQTLVSLTLSTGGVPMPLALRLFLPKSWTTDITRLQKAGVPPERCSFRSKPEIALEEIDRVRAGGVRFGVVLIDAVYRANAAFRQELSKRELLWVVGVPHSLNVDEVDKSMLAWRRRRRRRPRLGAEPDQTWQPAETVLAQADWTEENWEERTQRAPVGPLCRFARPRR
jgi:SRSO17 transposase